MSRAPQDRLLALFLFLNPIHRLSNVLCALTNCLAYTCNFLLVLSSIKLELEKFAQEKTEMQRHYVMVSLCASYGPIKASHYNPNVFKVSLVRLPACVCLSATSIIFFFSNLFIYCGTVESWSLSYSCKFLSSAVLNFKSIVFFSKLRIRFLIENFSQLCKLFSNFFYFYLHQKM